nr:hypothetical protein CFP56_74984 [Quercus suber]
MQDRPSLLDVDKSRSSEVRSSLTSLPDLIRRATKLASNLDRGKTASRLGMSRSPTEDAKRESDRYSTGLSDILASFPSPIVGTSPESRVVNVRRNVTRTSTRHRHSELRSNSEASHESRQSRKCCGLTRWKFVVLVIILFLLLVAAVVVPVVLIVLPRQRHHNASSTNSQLARCQKTMTCENGGATTFNGGTCGCICINGFTGSRCGSGSQQGCTTISTTSMSNATVGSEIQRIVSNAQSDFGIPLDEQTLLGLFSSADLSCNAENALVTFTNVVQRDLAILQEMDIPDGRATTRPRADTASLSNETILAESTSSAAATTASTTVPDISKPFNLTTTTDFARTAVLYIFQASRILNTAVNAQTNFQEYFLANSSTSPGSSLPQSNLTLGNGFSCDLGLLQLHLPNGTTVN